MSASASGTIEAISVDPDKEKSALTVEPHPKPRIIWNDRQPDEAADVSVVAGVDDQTVTQLGVDVQHPSFVVADRHRPSFGGHRLTQSDAVAGTVRRRI